MKTLKNSKLLNFFRNLAQNYQSLSDVTWSTQIDDRPTRKSRWNSVTVFGNIWKASGLAIDWRVDKTKSSARKLVRNTPLSWQNLGVVLCRLGCVFCQPIWLCHQMIYRKERTEKIGVHVKLLSGRAKPKSSEAHRILTSSLHYFFSRKQWDFLIFSATSLAPTASSEKSSGGAGLSGASEILKYIHISIIS